MVPRILNRGLNGPDASFQSPETEAKKLKSNKKSALA